MKIYHLIITLGGIAGICLMGGCASTESQTRQDIAHPEKNDVRNQAYSLFFKLMNDEKEVNKLLLIKNESSGLHELIEKIAKHSGRVTTQMEQFHAQDPSIALNLKPLPAAEVKTRAIIRSARTKELLFTGGKEFELSLALSQAEALSYASSLAKTISEVDQNPTRRNYFSKLSRNFQSFHQEIFSFILK